MKSQQNQCNKKEKGSTYSIYSLCLKKEKKCFPQLNTVCTVSLQRFCHSVRLALPSLSVIWKKVYDSTVNTWISLPTEVSELQVYRAVVTVDKLLLQFPFGSTALSTALQTPSFSPRQPSLASLSSELFLLLPCCSLCQLCLL